MNAHDVSEFDEAQKISDFFGSLKHAANKTISRLGDEDLAELILARLSEHDRITVAEKALLSIHQTMNASQLMRAARLANERAMQILQEEFSKEGS